MPAVLDATLFWVFAGASLLYVSHLGLYLIGANLYDSWQYRRLHHHHRNNRFQQPAQRARVSVLISAHNESSVLVRCLESIRKNTYKNIQIIVVDDASEDATLSIARNYKRKHPRLSIQVARMRQNAGKAKALNHALDTFATGDFVMTLDADSILDRKAIANALTYFSNPAVAGVAANVRIMDAPSPLGMLQKLEHMIGYRSKKFYSIMNCEFVIGGVASTYRMDILRKVGFYDSDTLTEDIGLSLKVVSRGNRRHRLVYGADVVAMTEPVDRFVDLLRQRYRWKYGSLQNIIKYRWLMGRINRRFTKSLTFYRLPMALLSEIVLLLAPFVWGYVIYISVSAQYPGLIVGAYVTIMAYTLVTLWFDEHMSLWQRLRLSMYAPIAYFIFYIMDVVQLVAVIRCVFRAHHLARQTGVSSTWISPRRIGGEAG